MKVLFWIAGWLLVSTLGVAAADVPAGVGASAFSRIGIDGRPLAMGGAFVAVASERPVPYYNSAALLAAPRIGATAMYSQPYGPDFGITFQDVCVYGRLDSQTASARAIGVAAGWVGVSISDIVVWDEDDPGSSETFTATSSIFSGSVGVELRHNLAVGCTVKYYHDAILEGRSRGLGVDVGLLGSFSLGGVPVTVGANLMDVGRTRIQWHGTEGEPVNYVPWVNKIGASAVFGEGLVLAACDLDWAVDRPATEQRLRVGVEVNPVRWVFVRGGWSSDFAGKRTISGGVGLELLRQLWLDYAYVPNSELGATHFVSMHVSF